MARKGILKEMVEFIGTEIENQYLDGQNIYLEVSTREILDELIHSDYSEKCKEIDIFDKIALLIRKCLMRCKKSDDPEKMEMVKEETLEKILAELYNFGISDIVEPLMEAEDVDEDVSIKDRVIFVLRDKLRYYDHIKDQ